MAFDNDKAWVFDQETVGSFTAGQTGVYAIYNSRRWIYIGRGDIRQRLLAHLDGEIPDITTHAPTHFRAEVTDDSVKREQQLIREYMPACNTRLI